MAQIKFSVLAVFAIFVAGSLSQTTRTSSYVPNIKYSMPCGSANRMDPATGNFACTVKTGAECFQLCQKHGCFEWSFTSFMPSTDTNERAHWRCRCMRNICLYNYVDASVRAYGKNTSSSSRSNSSSSITKDRA